jgi:hypothetical protein
MPVLCGASRTYYKLLLTSALISEMIDWQERSEDGKVKLEELLGEIDVVDDYCEEIMGGNDDLSSCTLRGLEIRHLTESIPVTPLLLSKMKKWDWNCKNITQELVVRRLYLL